MSAEMTTMLAGVIEQAKEIVELKAANAALSAALEQAKEREKKLLMCHKEIVDLLQQCDEENPCDMVLVQDLADILNKHFLCEKEEEDDDE